MMLTVLEVLKRTGAALPSSPAGSENREADAGVFVPVTDAFGVPCAGDRYEYLGIAV